MELNRLDYFYLKTLQNKRCTGFFQSMTISEIREILSGERASVYKRLLKLVNLGYLEKGCKSGNADTFYITEAGLEILKIGGLEEDVEK